MPTVSVLVLTYNHKNYIKQCLDSILMQQTTFPFELVLGEDESDDGTRNICLEYAEKYPDKIKLFLRSRKDVIHINGKATGRYNFIESLKACQGKYIALCEGDDYWTDPLKLQKQVDFLETNKEFNICYHDAQIFNQESKKFENSKNININAVTSIIDLANGNFMQTPTVVIRNELKLPKWFTKCTIGDWVLYMIAINDSKIMRLDENMAVYRVHKNGIWSGQPEKYRIIETIKTYRFLMFSNLFDTKTKLKLKEKIQHYNSKLNNKEKVNYGKKQRLIHFLKYGKT